MLNNNNNNPICKAPECQMTSVALNLIYRIGEIIYVTHFNSECCNVSSCNVPHCRIHRLSRTTLVRAGNLQHSREFRPEISVTLDSLEFPGSRSPYNPVDADRNRGRPWTPSTGTRSSQLRGRISTQRVHDPGAFVTSSGYRHRFAWR